MRESSKSMRGIPQKPTSMDVTEELNQIKKVTYIEEERQRTEAERLRMLPWEFEKYLDFNKLIFKWERENDEDAKYKYEIPENTKVTNNTKIALLSSHLFLTHILKLVQLGYAYREQEHNVLDNLSEVVKIEIADIPETDKLQFDVYANKQGVRNKHFQSISFTLDSKGRIVLYQ